MADTPANWDLVPDPPDGMYYKYCCTLYDHSAGCHESVCICGDWAASYPAQWVGNLPAQGNSNCNGCSISSTRNQSQVRWKACTPDPDRDDWYDYSIFSECYELQNCEDADSPFPSMQEGFSYGSPIHEYDSGLSNYIESCDDIGGQIETASINCHTWYRCKSKPYWEWDEGSGSWIATACLSVEKTEEYIHDNGAETYIYVGRTWTYKVYSQNGELFPVDTVVYLSYAGSTVTNGVEFDSPSSVIIPAGKNYVDFELTVNVHPDAYQEFIKIEAISETYSSCVTTSNQILSEKSTPEDVIGECSSKFIPEDITDCHDFFKYYPANYPEIY